MKNTSIINITNDSSNGKKRLKPEIVFSWFGLPQYAARLLGEAISRLECECLVIGSSPNVPVAEIEKFIPCPVIWIDGDRAITWSALGIKCPKIFIQSGWGHLAFSSLGKEAFRQGSTVIGLSDANWRGDFRQLVLGAISFRLFHSHRYEAFLVPGKNGEKLLSYYGFPRNKIFTGMYGADFELFPNGPLLSGRPKRLLFVGQFISRKFVVELANAFIRAQQEMPGWELLMCGCGPLESEIPIHPSIKITGFVQPEELSIMYHASRFLVLPSRSDAWGLVVHEASLSGCGLILSDAVGSASDLACEDNSVIFKAGSEKELSDALIVGMKCEGKKLDAVQKTSVCLSRQFGPAQFAKQILAIFRDLGPDKIR